MRKFIALLLLSVIFLAGCGPAETPAAEATEEAEAVPIPALSPNDVIVEGVVEPTQWTELRLFSAAGGTIVELLVEPGDQVEAGDVILRLEATQAELAVREAQAAVASARAELASAQAGPRNEEIAAAEADVEAAEAALAQAMARRDQLTSGATEAEIAAAEAEVQAAEEARIQARDERDEVYKESDDEKTLENVDYRLYAAREALAAAEARLKIARETADERVREAHAGVLVAEAQKDIAIAELDLLEAGRAGWEVDIAEAAVAQAQVALAQAEVALERIVLTAPFAGTITKVDVEVGNTLAPGQVVGVLAALDSLQVRTTDLTELDVTRIEEGDPVVVSVDAIENQSFDGFVRDIAHRPGDYRGDVVYAVTVELNDTGNTLLKWGMTAMVEIETE